MSDNRFGSEYVSGMPILILITRGLACTRMILTKLQPISGNLYSPPHQHDCRQPDGSLRQRFICESSFGRGIV